MKTRIKRFPAHQNAKVVSVLMAVGSLLFAIPAFFAFMLAPAPAEGGPAAPPAFMFLLLPVLYLVIGYVSVAIGCLLYNLVSRYTGGIEYETGDERT